MVGDRLKGLISVDLVRVGGRRSGLCLGRYNDGSQGYSQEKDNVDDIKSENLVPVFTED